MTLVDNISFTGIDPHTNKPIRILTPREDTPRFINALAEVRNQLDKRNLWGYTVVSKCLHIRIYKGAFRIIGAGLLKTVGDLKSKNNILINYLTVINSLNKPFFTLPFEKKYLFDILFDRVNLYFLLDLDAFIALASEVGMRARWATVKETNKVKAKAGKGVFIYNGRGIIVALAEDVEFKTAMFVADGAIHRIVYEHIDPAYVMYSFHYYLTSKEEMEGDKEK